MVRHHFEGLTSEQVTESRRKHGTNELPPPQVETFWEKLWDNFNDSLIKILVVALIITIILAILGYSDWLESVGIASAVFLATFVSTYSEHKNEASFQALQTEAGQTHSKVFREGHLQNVLGADLVVGDYVLLQPGEIVPADGVLVSGHCLLNESSLTGESEPTCKIPAQEEDHSFSTSMSDAHCVRRSCIVVDGEAVMLVNSVGTNTEYGRIADQLSQHGTRESPLQVKLSVLAEQISKLGYFGASLIAVSFLFKQFIIDNHWSWNEIVNYFSQSGIVVHDIVKSVILAIIVIVVAVPEGLPMMIAIVLSLNMNRLLKDKVLVRKLLGIETAGSISMLFTDKTGTLTHGKFEPVLFLNGAFQSYNRFNELPRNLAMIVNASLRVSTECIVNDSNGEIVGGNASDQAVLSFLPRNVLMQSYKKEHLDANDFIPNNSDDVSGLIAQIEPFKHIMFNSTRKFSATSIIIPKHILPNTPLLCSRDGYITFLKGAPELLLSRCCDYYTEEGRLSPLESMESLISEINIASARGIRVIVVATTPQLIESEFEVAEPPRNLSLVGIIGIRDEIRPTTKGALQTAREAGIHTIMITGDKKETAIAVAKEVGLLDDLLSPSSKACILTSDEMRTMSDNELALILPNLKIIARALPTDKSRLVQVAQQAGQVVGMTGDGLNDAVALRMADVGFAMGSGVDVAKEASDIIVLDDNFSSTMKSVLYGRTIFKSIRKFIVFQSTINLASTIIVFMGPILGFDFPLTLIQLLWVNLVMDTLAALAFGGEAPLARYMTENPIPRNAPIISEYMWSSILCNGLYISLISIMVLTSSFVQSIFVRNGVEDHEVFLTAFFCFFIFISNFNAFNARTTTVNLLDHITDNRNFVVVVGIIFFLQFMFTYLGGSVLRTVPLNFMEWFVIVTASSTIIPLDLFRKTIVVPRLQKRAKMKSSIDHLV